MASTAAQIYASLTEKNSKGTSDYPPPGKGAQMDMGCMGESEEKKEDYIIRLRYDLANTYLWSGNFFKDYVFFIANWHPILGILLCHPQHPWGKRERLQMTLISLFLTMPMSVFIAKRAQIDQLSSGAVTGLTLFFVTIPDTIIGIVLYQLSIAHTRCPSFAGCLNIVNRCCLNCFLVIGILSSVFCYFQLQGTGIHWVEAFEPLLIGKVYSYATWFPLWFLLPCMGYLHQWYSEYKDAARAQRNQEEERNSLM